ncbi:MAG: type II secretion system protein [Thermoleophilia bacterium]|nr:type II secretion system protein [Thermoleophilia bacterium]
MEAAHSPIRVPSRAPSRDSAFTVIEIMVVLLIVAVLMSIAIVGFGGARHESRRGLVRTAAQSYAESIDAFALDHAGRVPRFGTADWPVATSGPVKPNTVSASGSTYLGTAVPDPVAGGNVDVTATSPTGGGVPPKSGILGSIVYLVQPPVPPATSSTQYRIEVWMVSPEHRYEPKMSCYLGSWSPGGEVDRCA